MFSQNFSSIKFFSQNPFCGSFGISLSTGRNVGRGKVAYNWISPDPAKAGPILGGGGVVVVLLQQTGLKAQSAIAPRGKQKTFRKYCVEKP